MDSIVPDVRVSVSGAGDLQWGWFFEDLFVSARYAHSMPGQRCRCGGETYVIYGRDYLDSITHNGSTAGETLPGPQALI